MFLLEILTVRPCSPVNLDLRCVLAAQVKSRRWGLNAKDVTMECFYGCQVCSSTNLRLDTVN